MMTMTTPKRCSSPDAGDRTKASTNGVIAVLDLPVGTAVTMDGHALMLKRNDFVGFDHVPSLRIHGEPIPNHDSAFHFITVRSGNTGDQSSFGITVGFVIMEIMPESSSRPDAGWIVARRYDPKTEEVSSVPVDQTTASNLLQTICGDQMEPQRVISYNRILKPEEAEAWGHQTRYISKSLLKRRGLTSGDKIVPGSYKEPNHDDDKDKVQVDGVSVSYPPIPVIDSSVDAHKTRHEGTKRYLAQLLPSERTALFTSDFPANVVLQQVLKQYYNNDWRDLLGDVQLSFMLFLQLQCLSSLEHWRDLLSMLSLVQTDEIEKLSGLYAGVLQVLSYQVSSMEQDFFEDVEYSGGNFFIPAIQRLCSVCSSVTTDVNMKSSLSSFVTTVTNRFPTVFSDGTTLPPDQDVAMENERVEVYSVQQENGYDTGNGHVVAMQTDIDHDSDDDSGPVIVPTEEVAASLTRSSVQQRESAKYPMPKYPDEDQKAYPLLFASLAPQEDVLMACARILDEASDVSLVREAAAYLEEVESNKL